MDRIQELIAVVLGLLPAGAAVRGIYCLIKMQMDAEQVGLYKRRLINLLIFTVIAECAVGVMYCVYAYFLHSGSGGSF